MVEKCNMSELIKVEFDDKGIAEGFIIPCEFFKPNGKWYMEEDVVIPLDTPSYAIFSAIKCCRRVGHFITTGNDLRGIPFMVLPD